MIWNFLKKNRLVGVLSFLILSVLFSFFGFTSRSYADSNFQYTNGGLVWSSNWSAGPWVNYWQNVSFTGQHNWDEILGPNGTSSNSYSLYQYRYQGVSKGWVKTTSVSASGEYASISGQFNLVAMNINSGATWMFQSTDDIVIDGVTDLNASQIFQIESQDVQTVLTDWSWTNVPVYGSNLINKTLTVYFDLVIKIPQNYSGGFNISYSLPNRSFVYNFDPDGGFYLYYESGSGSVSFSDDRELALLQMQNSILNRQLAIEEARRQEELQDRQNLQNSADSSVGAGQSASSQASTATTPLIGAITTIYGTLTNARITDCAIGPINLYGELNLGTLQMCQLNTPTEFFTFGAPIVIGIILLLAWSALHAAMRLYSDLFGGGKS